MFWNAQCKVFLIILYGVYSLRSQSLFSFKILPENSDENLGRF